MYTLVFVADILSLLMLLLLLFVYKSLLPAEMNINLDFSIACFLLLLLPAIAYYFADEFSGELGVRTSFQ
jgi:uncharacterized membrane-anchored protein